MPLRDDLLRLAGSRNLGALVTLKRDGRPQLSNVNYCLATDPVAGTAVARVSVTDGRAKVANLRRDPRASLMVGTPDGWSYAVLEGRAELSPVAAREDDATVEELIDVYRAVRGEDHPDWDDYRRAMVADRRLVLRLHVEHTYGVLQ
jgi:PPOX class probable F420-dependent enzyme